MPMTPEEKRAKDAERKRISRAKAKADREAAAAKARTASASAAGTEMRDEVTAALDAMKWLQPSDAAAKAQAKMLARTIDELEHEGDRIRLLSAHQALTRVLHELGGTPTVRMQHELRSLKVKKGEVPDGGDGGGEASAGGKAGNVSRFERPQKRRPA